MATEATREISVKQNDVPATEEREQVRTIVPPVDIYENNEGIILLADMPGVPKENLDVQVDKDVLTIKGKIAKIVPDNWKPIYSEFGAAEYERAFTLGADVDISKIDAKISKGVLRLFLPKAEEVKPKKIKIEVE